MLIKNLAMGGIAVHAEILKELRAAETSK